MISFGFLLHKSNSELWAIYCGEKGGINQHLSASLGNGGSNAVQITLTIDGDLASTIVQKEQKKSKGISFND